MFGYIRISPLSNARSGGLSVPTGRMPVNWISQKVSTTRKPTSTPYILAATMAHAPWTKMYPLPPQRFSHPTCSEPSVKAAVPTMLAAGFPILTRQASARDSTMSLEVYSLISGTAPVSKCGILLGIRFLRILLQRNRTPRRGLLLQLLGRPRRAI
jgi:hypothetical protein